MGNFIQKIIKIIFYISLITNSIQILLGTENSLEIARKEFLEGKYEKAIKTSENLDSIESKIFHSRVISIYTYFYMEGEIAKDNYLKAYKVSKHALSISNNNPEAFVEAAHALGRYGQEIGIMAAISEGIADRVKKYLNKALSLDEKNIVANLSKGIWHAEIVNQAGKTLARALYGARPDAARQHFQKVLNQNNDEIAILYELSYGYFLLGDEEDLSISKTYIDKLLNLDNKSHLDQLYKKKALKLKNKILK